MRTTSTVGAVLLVGSFLLALTSVASRPVQGQPAPAQGNNQGPKASQYRGAASCTPCHSNPNDPFIRNQGSHEFVKLEEGTIWFTQDMHYLAFKSLETDLGRQMSELLGWDVTHDARCLACHSLDMSPEIPLAEKMKDVEAHYREDQGISCEACHGPGEGWYSKHQDTSWRELSPEVKTEAGQVDLRDPVVRAKKCASCHVGNTKEGKYVTHDMYAAGHPPLPGFEILTFSEDEPSHWWQKQEIRYITELAEKSPEKAWELFHYRPGEDEQARLLAVGAIISFRETMASLAEEARLCLENGKQTRLIDFAYFDCYGCHHDLEYPSERQERGYSGLPGRPTLRAWPVEMARLTVRHAAEGAGGELGMLNDDLNAGLANLRDALNRISFGDPVEVAASADELVAWSEQALDGIANFRYTPEETRRLVMEIINTGKSVPTDPRLGTIDYEAAQQLASSFNVLRKQLAATPPGLQEEIDKVNEIVQIHFGYSDSPEREFIAQRLQRRYDQLYSFKADPFAKQFNVIDQLFTNR